MSRIEELLSFRIASINDADRIMAFIKECWNSGHILANNKEFFLYEYGNGDNLNFLIAENKLSNRLEAIYAFYLYSDPESNRQVDSAGGLSRVRDDCPVPMVGTYMYKKLLDLFNIRCMLGVGLNRNTAYEINKRLFKYEMGELTHYYRLSDSFEEYRIAEIVNKSIRPVFGEKKELDEYSNQHDLFEAFNPEKYENRITYKDKRYLIHRYFEHPVYHYLFYVVENDLILVCREIELFGRKILRIVDCIGNVDCLRKIGYGIQKLIEKNNYEYVDLLAYGIEDDLMFESGFERINEDDCNIIPNYFEPFVKENIVIYCTTSIPGAVVFKGDADQDRPNMF